jgi:negative modulator of initiation of replication
MPSIEISDATYHYLLGRVKYIGESADSILQRELGLSPADKPAVESDAPDGEGDLVAFVNSAEFTMRIRTTTDQYLAILGWLAKHHGEDFDEVLALGGRKRRYFGRSESDIASSGTSTHPRPIPGTSYWAMTNADTNQKRDMLREVLQILGYPHRDIETTANAI